jgi:LPS-assembly protein
MALPIARSDQGGRRGLALARVAVAFALWLTAFAGVLSPTTPARADAPPAAATARNPDKLYLEADQLVYDKDHNTVTAIGGVVLYYNNRVLQADKVIYDRAAKHVKAEGRVKLTDENGSVTYAPRFDLTDDFASGFADSIQSYIATDKTRFSSSRLERSAGSVTVLDQGVYTACEPCKDHPERPPLWQVRAEKIIENQQTHTIYFENAFLDIFGVPVAYIPYLSAPDPTVTRQSGFLAPVYTTNNRLGFGLTVPYFLALAPNYDLTLSPSYYTSQGAAGDAIWRQRLDNGEYSIRVSGIDQMRPSLFQPAPFGAGNMGWRGSVESEGKFYINDKWKFGWDFTILSDRFYLNDYRLGVFDPTQYFFQDVVSSVYLRGQDGRGFFDLSGYRIETTSAYLDPRQNPLAVPVLDYNRTFAIDPAKSGGLGGEVTVDFNAANITRTEALYQSVGAQQFDKAYNVYSVCVNALGNTTQAAYAPGNCLLRGIAGDYARASGQVSWQRKIVDPVGEVWTPFMFASLTGQSTNLNTSEDFTYTSVYGSSTIYNSAQPAFFNGASAGSAAIGMAGVGLDYRFPFVSNSPMGQQIIEPIGQIIVRPNEVLPNLQPNEDAQSLVFDETTLFAWSKYSGYDRIEGGTRANYGLQYTANFADGGHASFIGGQSIQLAGENSYQIADAANTGLQSGLDKKFSNYVMGETLQPFSTPISFTSKQQFDSSGYGLTRFDAILSAFAGGWTTSLDYAHYAAQPLIGWPFPREGLLANAKYKFANGFTIDGAVVVDMSRHYYDYPGDTTPRFYPTSYNFGVAYTNDCATFRISYASAISDPITTSAGTPAPPGIRDQTVLFELTLRTLGDVRGSTGVTSN